MTTLTSDRASTTLSATDMATITVAIQSQIDRYEDWRSAETATEDDRQYYGNKLTQLRGIYDKLWSVL